MGAQPHDTVGEFGDAVGERHTAAFTAAYAAATEFAGTGERREALAAGGPSITLGGTHVDPQGTRAPSSSRGLRAGEGRTVKRLENIATQVNAIEEDFES